MFTNEYSTEVSAFICDGELENNTVHNKVIVMAPIIIIGEWTLVCHCGSD